MSNRLRDRLPSDRSDRTRPFVSDVSGTCSPNGLVERSSLLAISDLMRIRFAPFWEFRIYRAVISR
jgi:hypothetical protein